MLFYKFCWEKSWLTSDIEKDKYKSEHISYLIAVFLLLTLNMYLPAGYF